MKTPDPRLVSHIRGYLRPPRVSERPEAREAPTLLDQVWATAKANRGANAPGRLEKAKAALPDVLWESASASTKAHPVTPEEAESFFRLLEGAKPLNAGPSASG